MTDSTDSSENGGLRREILDTTRHLLLQEGYQHLSMRVIAEAIGCSATSIYLYFDSKDALLHALIHEGMMQLRENLRETAAQYVENPVEELRALCYTFVEFGLENPEYYEIMFQLHPDRMERYPREQYREARANLDFFSRVLVEGAEQGIFEVEDPEVSASSIWASLHGTVSLLLDERLDVRIDRDAFIDTAVRQTIQGCRRAMVSS